MGEKVGGLLNWLSLWLPLSALCFVEYREAGPFFGHLHVKGVFFIDFVLAGLVLSGVGAWLKRRR